MLVTDLLHRVHPGPYRVDWLDDAQGLESEVCHGDWVLKIFIYFNSAAKYKK